MENIEPQQVLVALTVGGAILAGAARLFSSFSGSKTSTEATTAEDKKSVSFNEKKTSSSKAKKNKQKNKKKTAPAPKPVEQPKPAEPVKQPEEPVVVEEKPAVEVAPTTNAKKKKKKAKKKAKQAENAAKPTIAAAPLVHQNEVPQELDLDGWSTVPVKSKKKPEPLLSMQATQPSITTESSADSKKKEFKITVDIGEHVSLILGEAGSTIQNIQNVSGARINLSRGDKNSVATIVGDEEEIDLAKQMIVGLISNQKKLEVSVASRLDKAIISKPDTKQKIKDLSGANLVYKFNDPDDELVITISGEASKVDYAKKLVDAYLNGKDPEGLDNIKRMQVSQFQGKIIIGKGGAQISQLQRETNSTINVEFLDSSQSAIVSVIGGQEEMAAGAAAIKQFLAEHNFSATVAMPPDAQKGVVSRLNELRKAIPNLKVEVTEMGIHLAGSEEGLREGRALVLKYIDQVMGPPEIKPGEVCEKVVLGDAVGRVVGKNRSTLNSLVKRVKGVDADLKPGSEGVCYVYGEKSGVEKVVAELEALVKRYEGIVQRTKEEEEELREANWDVDVAGIRDGEDWGGFKLARTQQW